MPTIKDIAKAAGVSHGTVSNVLNGRGNVSVKKIKRVEEVAKQMGYQINARAKSLREGLTKTVSIILPNHTSEQYNKLYSTLDRTLIDFGYTTRLYFTNDQQESEFSILQEIASNRDYAVVTVSCFKSAHVYYEQLQIPEDRIVFVYRQPKKAKRFISFDFKRSGNSIGQKIVESEFKRIGIFTDSPDYSLTQDFKMGFLNAFPHNINEITFQEVATSHTTTYHDAFNFFSGIALDVIVTTDIEKARYVKNAHLFGSSKKLPAIYSLSDSEYINEDSITEYHLNYQLLGKEVAQIIIDESSNKCNKKMNLTLENKGFLFDNLPKKYEHTNKTLNILSIPSPSTDALEKLLPHFTQITGIKVRISIFSFEEIYDILSDIENHRYYDIIRIDMAGLPWFAEKALKPLNKEMIKLLSKSPKQLTDRYSYVNHVAYAIPFDPSIQMLFYRKDIFEDNKIQRMFYEKYKLKLKVPTTFEELNLISKFFKTLKEPDSPVSYGTCVSIGNTEIIASEFLLRYYAKGGQLVQHNHTLALIDNIAHKALESYLKHLNTANQLPATWWNESISLFSKGDVALIIVYMNLFSTIDQSSISPLIGFTDVPGDKPLLGGGSLSMSKYTNKDEEALAFFNWVYSNEIAEQITLLGGSSSNDSVYKNQKIMEQYPWLKFALDKDYKGVRESSFKSGQRFNLRKVEKIIGLALKNAINNVMTVKETIDYINRRLTDENIFYD